MFAARRAATAVPRALPHRAFHASCRALINVGDPIPDVPLLENSPGNKVSLAKELTGKGLIIGVPAAFSPSCSESHIPGYVNYPGLKDAGSVFVVSVNDPFVMKAWGKTLDPDSKSGVSWSTPRKPSSPMGVHPESDRRRIELLAQFSPCLTDPIVKIRFLGDPHCAFTNAVDLAFDSTAVFGQPRSKRYALVIEDGKVKEVHVEPDNTGVKGRHDPSRLAPWFQKLMIREMAESAVDRVLGGAHLQ
ncbi:hypothetical protein LTR28_003601 [Elasticomyces elasticus]|nr:hypothetical protein LTR28_003601 [Elasticomyces elasticus]